MLVNSWCRPLEGVNSAGQGGHLEGHCGLPARSAPALESVTWLAAFLLKGTLDTRGPRLGKAPVSCGLLGMQSSLDVCCHRLQEDGGRGSQIKTKGGSSSMRLGEADPFCGRERTGAGQV